MGLILNFYKQANAPSVTLSPFQGSVCQINAMKPSRRAGGDDPHPEKRNYEYKEKNKAESLSARLGPILIRVPSDSTRPTGHWVQCTIIPLAKQGYVFFPSIPRLLSLLSLLSSHRSISERTNGRVNRSERRELVISLIGSRPSCRGKRSESF